ncbi:hypothetical protein HPB47_024189 [Ixodes persulcatus]|uniref:Uncharacterized protein n=1 Tax=Ixodes persulcatus TaxID=34615 RepID=A0AC60Q754_IXOPE|nr:hypothetical protein HPB47_024189 [Ixodes persulcatus]
MESEDSGGEWRRYGRKRCRPKNSDSSSDVPQQPKRQDNTSLTVIFVPVKEETRLSALNSLKVSEALEKLCQECIIQVRPNDRLNLIAVDVRNGQAAKTLINTAMLCAVPVRAYSPLSGPSSYGVIQGVDAEITEDEIARNLRAEDTCCKIANVRRLGRSRVVKVAFTSTKLPSYVLLGHGWGRTGGGGGATFWPAVMWVPRKLPGSRERRKAGAFPCGRFGVCSRRDGDGDIIAVALC